MRVKDNNMTKRQCTETRLSLEEVLEQIDDISMLDCFSEEEVPEEEAEALLKELDAEVLDEPFMPGSDDEFSDCEGPIAEESDEEMEGRGSTPTCKHE